MIPYSIRSKISILGHQNSFCDVELYNQKLYTHLHDDSTTVMAEETYDFSSLGLDLKLNERYGDGLNIGNGNGGNVSPCAVSKIYYFPPLTLERLNGNMFDETVKGSGWGDGRIGYDHSVLFSTYSLRVWNLK
jgi:hypothetical protein